MVLHFAVPFCLLLSRTMKRRSETLAAISGALVLLTLLNVFWLVVPGFSPASLRVHWMDLALVIGIGGAWTAAFLSQLKSRPLVPRADPRLTEALHAG
jgi:hypothetical protein